ncbi:MAG TPA: site-specific integrase [Anaerolineae bacterium]|nr:site-specific integrase [Anaerolineae bacterium]
MLILNLDIAHINQGTLLQPAMKSWCFYLQDQRRSAYTIKAFEGDLNLLARFLPPDRAIGKITINDLNHFLNWVKNGRGKDISCSPKSLSRRVTTLKSFFRWLHQNGRIQTNPAENIVQHTVISPIPIILTENEQILALAAAHKYLEEAKPDTRPFTLLKLLLDTGIKKGECLSIKLQHIDLGKVNDPFLFVRYPDVKDRNKERKIALSRAWIKIYRTYLEQYNPIDAIFPWSPRRLEYILEDISNEAELTKHISFSMCRWTCALNDWQQGIEPDAIRQKLGISKIQWREVKMKLIKLERELPNS